MSPWYSSEYLALMRVARLKMRTEDGETEIVDQHGPVLHHVTDLHREQLVGDILKIYAS